MNEQDRALISRIDKYCSDIFSYVSRISYEKFIEDDMVNSACVMKLEQIGECANHISEEFKAEHDNIPWKKIRGMRNIIAHDYMGIKWSTVWNTLSHDIPSLHRFTDEILTKED
jgi:uncharacterized protein with HEPN domain